MRIIFLFVVLLVFSCDNGSDCPSDIYDCAGVCDGDAVVDECDICDDNPNNDCVQDCEGVWGGDAELDECDVCNGPGPIYECGCLDISEGDCDCAGNVEDCAGECGGSAVEDECGVCGGSGIVDDACDCDGNIEDCAGECGGSAVEDECGVCDDDSSNNCIQDCASEWGGDAVEDCSGDCGGTAVEFCNNFCIPFDDIIPDEDDEGINSLISNCKTYNDNIYDKYDEELSHIDSSFHFFPTVGNSRVFISVPHSQRTYRCTDPDEDYHKSEISTGMIGKILHEYTGSTLIYKRYKSDDPNHYDVIPECTQIEVFKEHKGQTLPYKQKILDYIDDNTNIKFVMDIHGFNRRRLGDVYLGTINGESLESDIGECLPEIIDYILHPIGTSLNPPGYSGGVIDETVTKFVHNIPEIIDAIQFEIEGEYRGKENCDTNEKFKDMIYSLIEIIKVANYLYDNYDE